MATTRPETPSKVRRSPASAPIGQEPAKSGRESRNRARRKVRNHGVEGPLDDDGPDGKAGPDALLAGEVERLDELAQPAREYGVGGEADDMGRDEVPETDVDLLPGDQDLPAQ